MTGIVILPAGRDDAFEDYKQFIRDGHPIEDIIESYLHDEDVKLFRTISVDISSTFEGRLVDRTWRNTEGNDITLVYYDGAFIAKHERVFEVERLNQQYASTAILLVKTWLSVSTPVRLVSHFTQ